MTTWIEFSMLNNLRAFSFRNHSMFTLCDILEFAYECYQNVKPFRSPQLLKNFLNNIFLWEISYSVGRTFDVYCNDSFAVARGLKKHFNMKLIFYRFTRESKL